MIRRIRSCLGWALAITSIVMAVPSQALMYLAETVGDWADGMIDD